MKPKASIYTWLVVALALFSFGMSAVLSRTVFERLPHLEDELTYLFQARMIARGDLTIPSPDPRNAFWQPFVIDRSGQRFGKYPVGFPAQLALGEWAGAAWVVNASYAALTVALVFALGSAIFDRRVGTIAAALTAFSPMALLLNSTLMSHSSALCFTLLFVYACWRLEHGQRTTLWGIAAGVGLGMVIANRPFAAVAIALPLVVWSGVRLLNVLRTDRRRLWRTLQPLLALSVVALLFAATIPLYSLIAVGDPTVNLYTLVWQYDRAGFGDCCGRNGHTLATGFAHVRFDLSLLAADLFGWQIGTFSPQVIQHLRAASDYYPNIGVSWLLLLPALVVAFRRRVIGVARWLLLGFGWAWLAVSGTPQTFATTQAAWLWVGVSLVWLLLPLLWWGWRRDTRHVWTWLLIALPITLIVLHLTYWVGSQRYSTRYFYEGVGALAILGALPLAWLVQRGGRAMSGCVLMLLLIALVNYSLPRINTLFRYNNVSQCWIDTAVAQRTQDRPLLVIVTGTNLTWRSIGSFMAVTSPYRDSDIVAVYNRVANPDSDGDRARIIAQFPERQVIDLRGEGSEAMFVDEAAARQHAGNCRPPQG
jgi:4-amino-4-deoxy-L-arabinose transferase-like glycosyltransferase